MDIRQLTYFVSTYKHNSFSAAAKECCVTVQTISKAISNLETDLDNESLFIRKNNGVVPTEFGRAFYPKATEALESFNKAVEFVGEYRERIVGKEFFSVVLCAPDFPRSDMVCRNVSKLTEALSGNIKTQTKMASLFEGFKTLDSLEADMLVTIGEPDTKVYDVVRVGVMATAVTMAENHPLAEAEFITKKDLETYPIYCFDDFDAPRSGSIVNMYSSEGYNLNLKCPLDTLDFGLSLFRDHGMCLVIGMPAIVPINAGLIMKHIDPSDMISVPICLVTRKGKKPAGYDALEHFLLNGGLTKGFAVFNKA